MNTCRRVITCRDLMDMNEFVIKHEMKKQDVIDVKFITIFKKWRRKNTGNLVLTFG